MREESIGHETGTPSLRWCVLLTIFLVTEVGAADPSVRVFQAYDCSRPVDKTPVRPNEPPKCDQEPEPIRQEDKEYLLLQRAVHNRILVKTCIAKDTRMVLYCGTYDHQTVVTTMSRFNTPIEVESDDCRVMWDKATFIDNHGNHHSLTRNGTTIIQWEEVGRTPAGTSHVDCEGGIYWHRGQKYENMVVWHQRSITLVEQPATINPENGEVVLYLPQTILPCHSTAKACIAASGTHLWGPPSAAEACLLHNVRKVKGTEVTDNTGRITFVSTDGAMVRLIRGSPRVDCGKLVFGTNYQQLFLAPDLTAITFLRPLHPAEMSVTTYANQQDAFLYHALSAQIRNELKAVVAEDCQRAKVKSKQAYARKIVEQQAALDGDTAHMGDGWFTTAAGDAWYRYRCRDILVVGKDLDRCYSALPVILRTEDEKAYREARDQTAEELQHQQELMSRNAHEFFIEPHSHRLTTVGIPMPCSTILTPLYRNVQGHWLRVTPALELTANPNSFDSLEGEDITQLSPTTLGKEYNFEAGGIYTAAAVRAMDEFAQAPRKAQDMSVVIANQFPAARVDSFQFPIALTNVSPGALDWMTWIWAWVYKYGQLASVFLGLYAAGRVIIGLLGLMMRCVTIYMSRGIGCHLLWALCPTWRVFKPMSAHRHWVQADPFKDLEKGPEEDWGQAAQEAPSWQPDSCIQEVAKRLKTCAPKRTLYPELKTHQGEA